ncbi:unnamed protein product [Gordionus sp. m RMFG-2023]
MLYLYYQDFLDTIENSLTESPWDQFLVWNYSCIDLLALSNQTSNLFEQNEQHKISKYSEISEDHIFIPIISTTLKTFGKLVLSFFKNLVSHIRWHTSIQVKQRLAIAILKANYQSFNGSLLSTDLC